ncbi:transcription elongation factor GreA [Candidatus Peregrinibacteria bacterium]|nr:transcription elongation factor GreA [Candidatus Peregrinibacteria bacterium]
MTTKKSVKSAKKSKSSARPQKVPPKKVLIPKVLPKSILPKDILAPSVTENSVGKDAVLITEDGLSALKQELEFLTTEKRREVARRLKEAISYGDLSENSEYEEAKNEQAFIEGRILELEKKVKNAKIIASAKAGVARIGSTVVLSNSKTKEEEEYTIVGSTEADPMSARISNESPVGSAVLGKKKGDSIIVNAPGGKFEYVIMKLK